MYDDDCPRPGVITGIGRVRAGECMIVANDTTVKGGTYYPSRSKHLRAQERSPPRTGCRASTWSTGAGPILAQSRTRSSRPRPLWPDRTQPGDAWARRALPRSPAVLGSCTAGGAYVPAMSDEAVIVAQPGHHLPRRPAAGEGRDGRRSPPGTRRRRPPRESGGRPTTANGLHVTSCAGLSKHRRQHNVPWDVRAHSTDGPLQHHSGRPRFL